MTYTVSSGTLNSSIPYHTTNGENILGFLEKGNSKKIELTSWQAVVTFSSGPTAVEDWCNGFSGL